MLSLAGHLGRTVAELEVTLGANELNEWIALAQQEPWGPYRLDTLATLGWSYSVMAAHLKDPAETARRISLPWWTERPADLVRQVTPEEMRLALLSLGAKPVERSDG